MNLTEEARRLLTCDELRGRVPQEVQEFLRVVAGLEPLAYLPTFALQNLPKRYWKLFGADEREDTDSALYTLEPRHD